MTFSIMPTIPSLLPSTTQNTEHLHNNMTFSYIKSFNFKLVRMNVFTALQLYAAAV